MSTNPQLKAKCRVLNYVNINILKKINHVSFIETQH